MKQNMTGKTIEAVCRTILYIVSEHSIYEEGKQTVVKTLRYCAILLPNLNALKFSDFAARVILKSLLHTDVVTASKILKNIYKSLLLFCYNIKPTKSSYFVFKMQKYI